MRRVYLVYIARTVLQPAVIKALLVGVLLWRVSRYVSFAAVLHNMPRSYDALPVFVSGAFANTEAITLVLLAAVGAVGIWLIRDVAVRTSHAF